MGSWEPWIQPIVVEAEKKCDEVEMPEEPESKVEAKTKLDESFYWGSAPRDY